MEEDCEGSSKVSTLYRCGHRYDGETKWLTGMVLAIFSFGFWKF